MKKRTGRLLIFGLIDALLIVGVIFAVMKYSDSAVRYSESGEAAGSGAAAHGSGTLSARNESAIQEAASGASPEDAAARAGSSAGSTDLHAGIDLKSGAADGGSDAEPAPGAQAGAASDAEQAAGAAVSSGAEQAAGASVKLGADAAHGMSVISGAEAAEGTGLSALMEVLEDALSTAETAAAAAAGRVFEAGAASTAESAAGSAAESAAGSAASAAGSAGTVPLSGAAESNPYADLPPTKRCLVDSSFWDTCPERDIQLLTPNPYSRPQYALEEVHDIVIHYVANPDTTAQQNRDYFESLKDGSRYASSHFVVGLDGEIIQCISCSEWSYASNDRNADTISIECCHPDWSGRFTDATYNSVVSLTAWLCGAFGIGPEHVIRHYDVTGKICPKYYVENPEAWDDFLADVKTAYEGYYGK